MRRSLKIVAAALILGLQTAGALAQQPNNLILFIPDGLRALSVTPETAPTMAALRDQGVNFRKPHSLFPTFTMPNASALALGHFLGDTGVFSNTIYAGYPVAPVGNTVTPFIENDDVLGDIDTHYGGSFIDEETVLRAAQRQGFSTAALGKLGPTLLFNHTQRSGDDTIFFDDVTGPKGVPLSQEIKDRLTAAGLPLATPARGDNGKTGDFKTPGTIVANLQQQSYFVDAATKVVLPLFKARGKPFVLVFWSRDPDGTQHNQGDSFLTLTPGINGPTSIAAIRNADDNLKALRQALDDLGLAQTTNIVIAADHGFSTVSKESATSPSAKMTYEDVPAGMLPPGFVAIDIAKALNAPLYDPDFKNALIEDNKHTRFGHGLIGADPLKPDVIVASNGGSNLIYVPGKDKAVTGRVVDALLKQDYVSGIFVDDDLGSFPGTLPLSAINLKGTALTPLPAIVISFRSFASGCDQPELCSVTVCDSRYQHGQGMHGSFSRADTMNFMAAFGPSFKSGFADDAPASNADIGKTMAHVLDLKIPFKGSLMGRVLDEAMPNGKMPDVETRLLRSEPASNGLATVVNGYRVGHVDYFTAGGFPGRTVGLEDRKAASR